jgi:hypothetical protein
MNKIIKGLGASFLLVTATTMWGATPAPAGRSALERQIEQTLRDVPFKDIGNIMQNEIAGLLRDIQLGMLADPVKHLGAIVKNLPQMLVDLQIAVEAARDLSKITKCAKMKEEIRVNDPTCKEVGAAMTRARVVAKAIGRIRLVLKPVVQDLFIGYTDKDGAVQPPALNTILDMVQQPGQKAEIKKIADVLQGVWNVLGELQKLLGAGE